MDAGRLICTVAIGLIGLFLITVGASGAEPEQIHLAVTETQNEMVVQWGTEEDTQVSCNSPTEIEYGTESDSLDMSQSGTNEMYDWTTCIHTVILPDLEGDTTYYYRVGGNGEWSDVYSFTTHSTLLIADNDIRIGAIARGKDIIIPSSDFVFLKDDVVVFLAKRDQLAIVENMFRISSI